MITLPPVKKSIPWKAILDWFGFIAWSADFSPDLNFDCLLKTLTDGLEWCGLLWCFIRLSFWRHPFTAEHPLLRHWRNKLILTLYEGNGGDIFSIYLFIFGKLLKFLFYCIANYDVTAASYHFLQLLILDKLSQVYCIAFFTMHTMTKQLYRKHTTFNTNEWKQQHECLYWIVFVSLCSSSCSPEQVKIHRASWP